MTTKLEDAIELATRKSTKSTKSAKKASKKASKKSTKAKSSILKKPSKKATKKSTKQTVLDRFDGEAAAAFLIQVSKLEDVPDLKSRKYMLTRFDSAVRKSKGAKGALAFWHGFYDTARRAAPLGLDTLKERGDTKSETTLHPKTPIPFLQNAIRSRLVKLYEDAKKEKEEKSKSKKAAAAASREAARSAESARRDKLLREAGVEAEGRAFGTTLAGLPPKTALKQFVERYRFRRPLSKDENGDPVEIPLTGDARIIENAYWKAAFTSMVEVLSKSQEDIQAPVKAVVKRSEGARMAHAADPAAALDALKHFENAINSGKTISYSVLLSRVLRKYLIIHSLRKREARQTRVESGIRRRAASLAKSGEQLELFPSDVNLNKRKKT